MLHKRRLLEWVIVQLQTSQKARSLIVMTSQERVDDAIIEIANELNVPTFRGSENDILSRLRDCVDAKGVENLALCFGDNPFFDGATLDLAFDKWRDSNAEFGYMSGFPIGIVADFYTASTVRKMDMLAKGANQREHANAYIFDNLKQFSTCRIQAPEHLNHPQYRFTIDDQNDLDLAESIAAKFGEIPRLPNTIEAIEILQGTPELAQQGMQAAQQKYVSKNVRSLRGH